jgi:diphosphomevalonate decarboxylase
MKIIVTPETSKPELIVLYDGKERPSFEPKIKSFLNLVLDRFSWIPHASVIIDSTNTFPSSAGIASSASAMSALALCLTDIDDQINARNGVPDEQWWRNVSGIARLGSGSACRSVFPVASLWGEVATVAGSSDFFGIPLADHLSSLYHSYQDTILIVSTEEKKISSSAGHEMMNKHAYAESRYDVANKNLLRLLDCMHSDNEIDLFMSICESEALQLHALMMSGDQPFILIQPNTLSIIREVWNFRKESGIPVCFTLDAGPNVHLLYPAANKTIVLDWIKNNLSPFCADGLYILDEIGGGPEKLL